MYRQSHMKELEDRMRKVEGLMQRSSLLPDATTTTASQNPSREHSASQSAVSNQAQELHIDNIAAQKEPDGLNRSPQPTKPLPNFLEVFRSMPDPGQTFLTPSSTQKPTRQIFNTINPQAPFILLTDSYLFDVNPFFPLFDKDLLLTAMNDNYPDPSTYKTCDPAWWAIVNSIFAISIQYKTVNEHFPKLSGHAWNFFKNAWAVYGEIVARPQPTLLDVQALLTMARFLETTTDAKTFTLVTGSAIRMLQIIGVAPEDLTKDEKKRRVFWCAYMMDKRAGIEIGLPSLLDEQDVNTLPPLKFDMKPMANFFRLKVQLAVMDTRIRKLQGSQDSIDGSLQIGKEDQIQQLLLELESWKYSLPVEARPGPDIRLPNGNTHFPFVMLHLTYYNSLSMLHRMREDGHEDSTQASRLSLRLSGTLEPSLPFIDLW